MDIFELQDYREILRQRIKLLPRQGYGQLTRLARHIGINATLVSQVLSGLKNLTEDQGFKTAEFLQLSEQETTYFLLLIQWERAGNHSLKRLFEKEISRRQREAQKIRGRIQLDKELSFEQQAVFYSDWLFTAVHTLSSIEGIQAIDAMAEHLKIDRPRIVEVVNWLLQHGLCKEEKGKILVGPTNTFVDRDSILASRHHANWRQKALEVMTNRKGNADFFFTAPFSIAKKDYSLFRKELVQLIDGLAKRVEKSDPELMATINIDLFQT